MEKNKDCLVAACNRRLNGSFINSLTQLLRNSTKVTGDRAKLIFRPEKQVPDIHNTYMPREFPRDKSHGVSR